MGAPQPWKMSPLTTKHRQECLVKVSSCLAEEHKLLWGSVSAETEGKDLAFWWEFWRSYLVLKSLSLSPPLSKSSQFPSLGIGAASSVGWYFKSWQMNIWIAQIQHLSVLWGLTLCTIVSVHAPQKISANEFCLSPTKHTEASLA